MNKRIGLAVCGLSAGLLMIGGTAYGAASSIPDSSGVIHSCLDTGGNVKVIDTSVTPTVTSTDTIAPTITTAEKGLNVVYA